jgi:hypothetical protein
VRDWCPKRAPPRAKRRLTQSHHRIGSAISRNCRGASGVASRATAGRACSQYTVIVLRAAASILLIVLIAGGACLLLLFPHWRLEIVGSNPDGSYHFSSSRDLGRHFLFSPPSVPEEWGPSRRRTGGLPPDMEFSEPRVKPKLGRAAAEIVALSLWGGILYVLLAAIDSRIGATVLRYRRTHRLCLQCGYDVRESRLVCPECGFVLQSWPPPPSPGPAGTSAPPPEDRR